MASSVTVFVVASTFVFCEDPSVKNKRKTAELVPPAAGQTQIPYFMMMLYSNRN